MRLQFIRLPVTEDRWPLQAVICSSNRQRSSRSAKSGKRPVCAARKQLSMTLAAPSRSSAIQRAAKSRALHSDELREIAFPDGSGGDQIALPELLERVRDGIVRVHVRLSDYWKVSLPIQRIDCSRSVKRTRRPGVPFDIHRSTEEWNRSSTPSVIVGNSLGGTSGNSLVRLVFRKTRSSSRYLPRRAMTSPLAARARS
jgi:hypothetical protein